jgi:hypothetical protein
LPLFNVIWFIQKPKAMQSQDKALQSANKTSFLALYIFFKSLVKDFTLKLNLTLIYSQQGLEYYNKQYFFL